MKRFLKATVCSFLLAPLGAAVVLSLWGIWHHSRTTHATSVEDALGAIGIFTIASYLAMLVIGAPMFWLFRRLGWLSTRACAIGGGLAGLLFAGSLSVQYVFSIGLAQTLAQYGSALAASTVAGVAAGFIFAHFRSAAM